MAAHLESPVRLLKVLAPSSITSKSLRMGPSHQYLLKLSWTEDYILGKTHSKKREVMSGAVEKCHEEGHRMFLAQKKGAVIHVR